jgi:hypothetical protein
LFFSRYEPNGDQISMFEDKRALFERPPSALILNGANILNKIAVGAGPT